MWVDLHVFGADAQYLRPGVAVTVSRLYDNVSATTTIERVLPSTSTASQSLVARAALPNEDGFWRQAPRSRRKSRCPPAMRAS